MDRAKKNGRAIFIKPGGSQLQRGTGVSTGSGESSEKVERTDRPTKKNEKKMPSEKVRTGVVLLAIKGGGVWNQIWE